jgi:cyclase
MKKIILLIALTVLSINTLRMVTAQQRPTLTPEQRARVQIHPVQGKAGLYVIPGFDGGLSGGNVAVRVTGNGVILVDNKFSYSSSDIIRQVASVTSEPISYVLNTHHHSDHAGSNADFMPAAQVIGHENVRSLMISNDLAGAPPIVFSRRTSVFVGDVEVQAHHFGRGHTSGDSIIYFPDLRTVHTGDLFIWGDRLDGSTMAPFIDYANGGSAAEWTATLDGLLALDFDTAIPGHGPILTKADVRTFQDKFSRLILRMTRLIDSGTGRDDIATRLELADLNWPFAPQAVQAIYDELAGL